MKKFLCLTLSLVFCLLLMAPPSASLADVLITGITGTFVPPKAGTKVSTEPVLIIPDGAGYSVKKGFSLWYSKDDLARQYPLNSYGIQLKGGEQYLASFYIEPDDGYEFVGGTTNLNVSIAGATYLKAYSSHELYYASVLVKFTVPLPEKTNLKKINISKVSAVSKNKIKVEWKALAKADRAKIKQIEVQVSKDATFKTIEKSKTVSSAKTSIQIGGLKASTKYYVRIRACTKNGNILNVSKWSAKKNVKTKK